MPNFHNPAGTSLAEHRRDEILSIATGAGLLVLEDDPYGLLGFDQPPQRALRARTDEGVLYLGSFSKTFAPGLRVGWVLAPHAVREKLVLASEAAVLCPPTFNQLLVADYLATQPWRKQVDVFRDLYRERRDAMLECADRPVPGAAARWTHPTGGFYVWVTLPEGIDSKVMLPRAVHERVAYVPGTAFYADGTGQQHLRLSYCYPEPERISEGIRRLAGVLEEEMELRQTFGPSGPTAHPAGGADTPGSQFPAPDLA